MAPASNFDTETIEALFWTSLSIVGIVLMLITYTYIDKLERIKCACAEHPYKIFIKKYLVFAICFLLVTAFFPPSVVVGFIGPIYALVYLAIKWIYVIATIVFFVYALKYVRFLVQEKCKCSEDIRREVLYWWSIIELVILFILVLLPFFIMFVSGGISLAVLTGKDTLKNLDNNVMMTTVNPIKGVRKASSSFGKTISKFSKAKMPNLR